MADEYRDFVKAIGDLEAAGQLYQSVANIPNAKGVAAQYVLDELEDQTAAGIIADPNTPVEKSLGFLREFGIDKAKEKLEELVGDFDKVIKDAPEGLLEGLLNGIEPNVEYGEFGKYHEVYQNVSRKEKREVRAKEVKDFYDKAYPTENKGDNVEKNKRIKSMLLDLYDEDSRIRLKYQEINQEELEKFSEMAEDKEKLSEYILSIVPEDSDGRIGFIKQMSELQKRLGKEE